MDLKTPIKDAGIVYRMQARRLERLGITTIENLLYHIPQRYEDLSLVSKINILQPGETVTIQGAVLEIKNQYTRRRFVIQRAVVADDTGTIECVWFNQPFITKVIKAGDTVSLAGKVEYGTRMPKMTVKSYEVLPKSGASTHTGRLVPVYSETRGLSSKWFRNRIKDLLAGQSGPKEFLPPETRASHNLLDLETAIRTIHFPKTFEDVEHARSRLAFDEFLVMQLTGAVKRREWEEKTTTHPFHISSFKTPIQEFWEGLPFELTRAQKKAVGEIFEDLAKTRPMNRLLEGEVGSGKTVVAAIAMYLAHLNGFQSVFMAPTAILANQHYETISNLLAPLGIEVSLVTGKKRLSKNDSFSVLIGTHALLHKGVTFEKLGLVVIDEQQRFGVEQRAILREKGESPHFLTMTATPIPRTVFLTLYGDLDLSYLDEMPVGRKVVKTWLVPEEKREAGYEWIKKQVTTKDSEGNKNQAFIVCPFIEESESLTTVKAASAEYERLKTHVFPGLQLGLLHGRLKVAQKEAVLEDFRAGKVDILVTTPVVEVGIDIPNATIMVIEAADRFGLASLHQLRGRVGRRSKESYCLLFTEKEGEKTIQRLKLLEKSHQGAELAELDLRLRGPGQMYGTHQHGSSGLKIASFSNLSLIEKTKKEAEKIAGVLETLPALHEKVRSSIIQKVTPD